MIGKLPWRKQMGIKDLLRFMKPYTESVHISKYAGKRVGIDAYSWLHKGAYSCSMDLYLDSNIHKKSQYLNYFMHRINLLRHHNVIPVVVFDGGNTPCKATTEAERHRIRKANGDLAVAKLKEGNVGAAYELFKRAVSITPFMAHQLIQILRSENIEFVVAPYEADAQLAYLSTLDAQNGGVAAVITEDSDLMAYGCQAILFKMDRHGNGEEVVLDRVFDSISRTPSFKHFDKELFTGMCVLAGCDFLQSVPGIGIARAYSLVSKYRNLDRVLSVLKVDKGNQMNEGYSKSFTEAVAVFQHARIYDAESKKLKHLKPLPQKLLQSLDGELDFLGPEIPPSIATAIAEGYLDPISMEAFDHYQSSRYNPDPIVAKISGRLQRPELSFLSTQERRSMVFSSNKARELDITGAVAEEISVSNESKYLHEAAAIAQLLVPSHIQESVQNTMVPHKKTLLKLPDNNPFKRRKGDESDLDQVENRGKHVFDLTDVEDLDPLCGTPESTALQYSETHSSKRKLNKKESTEGSIVTEVEILELCVTPESQQSVGSKPKRISDVKGRGKTEKLKRSNCKSGNNTKGSILSFFSRV